MKKILFIVVMATGFITTTVLAQDPVRTDSVLVPTEAPAVEQSPQKPSGEFKEISVEELPSIVIETLKKDYPEGSITGIFAAEKETGKVYKVVVLKDKNNATSEETILFNEKGEKVLE